MIARALPITPTPTTPQLEEYQRIAAQKQSPAAISSPKNHDRITTSFPTNTNSPLDIKQTNLPAELPIAGNKEYSFIYSEANKTWYMIGKEVSYTSPFSVGSTIPNHPAPITFYSVSGSNWTPDVVLPAKAKNGDLVIVESSAKKGLEIVGKNIIPEKMWD